MTSPHQSDEEAASAAPQPRLTPDLRGVDQFTMQEAARLKGVSYHTVSRAVRKYKLPAHRSGRLVLISRTDLEAWEPMRARAPRSCRRRNPEPDVSPGVVELASGERFELARRISSLYEAIQTSALFDPIEDFSRLIVERFAVAMEFDRVALWVIDLDRIGIELLASVGPWFEPGQESLEPLRVPFDPEHVYPVPPDVYPGISCWMGDPRPVRMRDAYVASLIVNDTLVGYLIGDHDGASFTLSPSQIELGQELATQAAITIELRRSRDREASRLRELQEQTVEFADALAGITQAINEGRDLISILRRAGHSATQISGSHYGGVVLQVTPESVVSVWTKDGADLPARYYSTRIDRFSGVVRALEAGEPVLLSWNEASEIERAYWDLTASRSCLNLAFNIDGKLAGAILMRFRSEHPALSPEQLRRIELLAAGCVTAISRQHLVNALHARQDGDHADSAAG